jgi:hypothetical protein
MLKELVNRREFMLTSAATAGALLVAGHGFGLPQDELHVCPKSRPPARKISAFNLRESLSSYSWDMQLTLSCLQGIVNRSQPRLYLVHDDYDQKWLDWLRERGDIDEVEWLEVGEVFGRFLPEVGRMYIIDPAIPASINVATMLAGLHNGLVATPPTANEYNLGSGQYPDSRQDGLDLSWMGWKKDVEAYRWAFQQFGDKLSRKGIALLDPHDAAPRDYLVEFNIPTFWISGPEDAAENPAASYREEVEFALEILKKWPPNIPCFGWPGTNFPHVPGIGEDKGLTLTCPWAKFEVCTGYDGYGTSVGNLSLHSGTTATLRQRAPRPIQLQKDKVYCAPVRSDGDGMNFQRQFYRLLYDQPEHGQVPIGWQLGPMDTDLMPDIADYYYQKARPGDCMVNTLTGAGYIHEGEYATGYPPEEREKVLRDYINLSAVYRARIDASTMSTFSEMPHGLLAKFAGMSGIKGIFANYGRTHVTTLENIVTEIGGVPIFRAVNEGAAPTPSLGYTPFSRTRLVRFMIEDIKRWTPAYRPAFLHVFLADWLRDMGMLTEIFKGLGPEYVAVRPDQLVDLYHRSKGA